MSGSAVFHSGHRYSCVNTFRRSLAIGEQGCGCRALDSASEMRAYNASIDRQPGSPVRAERIYNGFIRSKRTADKEVKDRRQTGYKHTSLTVLYVNK